MPAAESTKWPAVPLMEEATELIAKNLAGYLKNADLNSEAVFWLQLGDSTIFRESPSDRLVSFLVLCRGNVSPSEPILLPSHGVQGFPGSVFVRALQWDDLGDLSVAKDEDRACVASIVETKMRAAVRDIKAEMDR